MSEPEYRDVRPDEDVVAGDQFQIIRDEWRNAATNLGEPPIEGMRYRRRVVGYQGLKEGEELKEGDELLNVDGEWVPTLRVGYSCHGNCKYRRKIDWFPISGEVVADGWQGAPIAAPDLGNEGYADPASCEPADRPPLEEILELLGTIIESTVDARAAHEETLGRASRKNRLTGEMYDDDLVRLQVAEATLKEILRIG